MFKKINTKLENLFDQKHDTVYIGNKSIIETQQNFQITDNNHMLENLSYIFSNEINRDNLSNLFSQLSSYFEIGFLMHKKENPNLYIAKEAFAFAKKIESIENIKPIKLPTPEIYKILSSKAHMFLKHYDMGELDSSEKMISYLIPISETHAIVIVTQTAEPWARLKIESLHKTLMKINFSL